MQPLIHFNSIEIVLYPISVATCIFSYQDLRINCNEDGLFVIVAYENWLLL